MDYMSSLIPTDIWRCWKRARLKAPPALSSFLEISAVRPERCDRCVEKVESTTTEHTRINPPELKPPITERKFNQIQPWSFRSFPTFSYHLHPSIIIDHCLLPSRYICTHPTLIYAVLGLPLCRLFFGNCLQWRNDNGGPQWQLLQWGPQQPSATVSLGIDRFTHWAQRELTLGTWSLRRL